MKVLLLAPTTPNPAPSYFGPPYALALFGAMLQERGHTVTAADLSREDEAGFQSALPALIERDEPDLIGITCLGINRGITVRAVRRLKELRPDVPIIVGGAYPTQAPAEFFERSPVDYICVGDGEETLLELVEALEAGRSAQGIRGLWYRDGDQVLQNLPRAAFTDLDALPFPDFDLFQARERLEAAASHRVDAALVGAGIDGRVGYRPNAALMVIGSRGCVFQCSFCPMSKENPRLRLHAPAYTAELMIHYRDKYGITDFVMGDNLFSVPRERAMKLCEELIAREAGLSWICMTRADTVDPELLAKMAEAGCREISYGVETLSWEVQRAMKKNLRTAPIVEVYQQTHDAGIQSNLMLMLGNEGESRASVRATAAGCRDIHPDRILLNTTKVYSGTVLFDRAVEKGMYEPEYFTKEDPEVREYTAENGVEELRVFERMLHKRTTYLQLTDALLAEPPDEAAIERAAAVMDLRSERVLLDIEGLAGLEQLMPLLLRCGWLSVKRLWLHTDGDLLRSTSRRLLVQKSKRVSGVIVPFYSMSEAHHDHIAGRKGAWMASRKGFFSWTRGGGKGTIWAYLDRFNVSRAADQVRWAVEHKAHSLLFIVGSDPAGWHTTADLPDLAEAGRAVSAALRVGRELGLPIEVTGLPECLLDEEPLALQDLWRPFDEVMVGGADPVPAAERRMADKHHVADCERCHVRHHCEGLWRRAEAQVRSLGKTA